MDQNGFHTFRRYNQPDSWQISASMEDYLEMIFRLSDGGEAVRVNRLAEQLNVSPPAASKMVTKLRRANMVQSAPYGIIHLTSEGNRLGQYLLDRHRILYDFFCKLNHSENELELVEKIEHFIDEKTVRNLEQLTKQLK